jgi:hypothetical protein
MWQQSLGIKTNHLPCLLAPISIPNPRYPEIEKKKQRQSNSIATIDQGEGTNMEKKQFIDRGKWWQEKKQSHAKKEKVKEWN